MNLKTVNGVLTKTKLELNLKACLRGQLFFFFDLTVINKNLFFMFRWNVF